MSSNFMNEESLQCGHICSMLPYDDVSNDYDSNQFGASPNADIPIKPTTTMKQIIGSAAITKKRSRTKGKYIKKITKSKAKIESDYRKNICGYITKKVIREFIYGNYKKKVQELCQAEHADYESAKKFYEAQIERVTGPSHFRRLFSTSNKEEVPTLKTFVRFFGWFLRERYVRHLFLEGKMENKKAYVEYKNKTLMPMVQQFEKQLIQNYDSSSTLNFGQFQGVL